MEKMFLIQPVKKWSKIWKIATCQKDDHTSVCFTRLSLFQRLL